MEESGEESSSVWPRGLPSDLTFYYQVQSFNDSRPAADYFAQAWRKIAQGYSAEIFEGFFWTTARTATFFASAPETAKTSPQFLADVKRHAVWAGAAEHFKTRVAPHRETDPCGLVAVAAFDRTDNGTMRVAVRHILDMADRSLAASCMAYVAAALTAEKSLTHLALTLRCVCVCTDMSFATLM